MREEWKKLIVLDRVHPWYSVSNLGNLVSHLIPTQDINNRDYFGRIISTEPKYDPNYKYDVKWSERFNKDGTLKCLYKKLVFPADFFQGTIYGEHEYQKSGKYTVTRQILKHQAVMWTFRDIQKFYPADFNEKLKENWENTPPSVKRYMLSLLHINHKDHDPSLNFVDLDNPLNDSLEYCSPSWNSRQAVKQYGGHVSNKTKNLKFEIKTKELNPLEKILEL